MARSADQHDHTVTHETHKPQVLLLAGLPGVGKSRLALGLAPHLGAVILNRDSIRDCIFPARFLDYSPDQNEVATRVMLLVLEYLLARTSAGSIIIEGKPFSRASEIDVVRQCVRDGGGSLTILHCVAEPSVIDRRLVEDISRDPRNVDAQRNPEKAAEIRKIFEAIECPHLEIDTSGPLQDVIVRSLATLRRHMRFISDEC